MMLAIVKTASIVSFFVVQSQQDRSLEPESHANCQSGLASLQPAIIAKKVLHILYWAIDVPKLMSGSTLASQQAKKKNYQPLPLQDCSYALGFGTRRVRGMGASRIFQEIKQSAHPSQKINYFDDKKAQTENFAFCRYVVVVCFIFIFIFLFFFLYKCCLMRVQSLQAKIFVFFCIFFFATKYMQCKYSYNI